MTDDDAEAFLTYVMGPLDLAFGKVSEKEVKVLYFKSLMDLPLEALKRATEIIIQRDTFFPKVADIRRVVLGSEEEKAALAWSRAMNAARRGLGGYTPITFNDPALHATVVRMGGWGRFWSLGFRDTERVDIATARKEFMELYPLALLRGIPDDTPRELCAEEENIGRLPATPVGELAEAPPREFPDEYAWQKALPAEKALPPAKVQELLKGVTRKLSTEPRRRALPSAPEKPAVADAERAEHERKKREALRRQRE